MDRIKTNLVHHVRVLASEIGSRSIEEPVNLQRAQDYIFSSFTSMGFRVHVQSYEAFGNTTANLIACSPGAALDSPLLLLGAHFDTIRGTPGADDNASAVAVLLETARLVTRKMPGETHPQTLFVAFSTEEPPSFNTRWMGSRIFVRSLPEQNLDIKGALVLEMVGYYREGAGTQHIPLPLRWMGLPDRANFVAVVGNGRSRSLVKGVSKAISRYGSGLPVQDLTVPGSGYLLPEARLSDNASFWDAGIPAVMVTDTSFLRNPHYHTHRDRPETLDYGKMAQLVEGLSHFFTDGGAQRFRK